MKNAKMHSSDKPPNVDHDEDIPSNLQAFVADMDQNIHFHLISFTEYSKLLEQMREEYDTLKAQISSLQESFTTVKKDFNELKVEHETLIGRTTQEHTALNRTVKDCLGEMNNERVKCEQQLRAVGDSTVLDMSTWSADFSRKCQSTLEKIQEKLTTLLSEYDDVVKPLENPGIHKYIPLDNTDLQEYCCLREGVLDKDTYFLINGLHIKVKDHIDRQSSFSTSSSPRKKYAPSENINPQKESNGRTSMFGNTYFLGKTGEKFSNMDAYEFPPGRSNILDVKNFIKEDTNTMTEISSKASVISNYKQYVAAAGRFGILITPPHEVARWGNEEYPPTCPYQPTDFETLNHFEHIYSQSSTAI